MRILVVSNLYPPQTIGGYERAMADYAEGLAARGHTILVLTSDTPDLPTGYREASGSTVPIRRDLQLYGRWTAQGSELLPIETARALTQANRATIAQVVQEWAPDVCLWGNLGFLDISVLNVVLAWGVPVIHYIMNAHPSYEPEQMPTSPLYHRVAVSHWIGRHLTASGYPSTQLCTIYPGAEPRIFYHEEPHPQDRLRVMYASLVMHYKGADVLVEALAILHVLGIPFTATIAGGTLTPDYVQALQEFAVQEGIGDRLQFVGLQTQPALAQLYRQHNTWVLPSRFEEPFGIAVVEAMQAGLATVGSDRGGIPEILTPGETGFLFEAENPLALAEVLQFLAENPDQRQAIAQRGQGVALTQFGRDRTLDQLENLLQEVVWAAKSLPSSPARRCGGYVTDLELAAEVRATVFQILADTDWEHPRSALDWHHRAVAHLLMAEGTQDVAVRQECWGQAQAAWRQADALGGHPLCWAHALLWRRRQGEKVEAAVLASIAAWCQPLYSQSPLPLGLVVLPRGWDVPDCFYGARSGWEQALRVLAVSYGHQVGFTSHFYRPIKALHTVFPEDVALNRKMGLMVVGNGQPEGVAYLHRAQQREPDSLPLALALTLAYEHSGNPAAAAFWRDRYAELLGQAGGPALAPKTVWFPYDGLWLAIEPRLTSIVTSILLAEGDWFEGELEFWRNFLQPGMTAIDVGANAGVYAFSAARRGVRVLAIEPFAGCVDLLHQTKATNGFAAVEIVAAAASDRPGTLSLIVGESSELNKVRPAGQDLTAHQQVMTVPAIALDDLLERFDLQQVDILKLDAEGHELAVLTGAQELLRRFRPVILYENLAGAQGSNLPVADWLRAQGYSRFGYRPYRQQWVPIATDADLDGWLNVVALPES
ncbi:MAG: FkbM family methyltransferase [Pseudanabaenaceae cyanobacterium]